MIIAEKLDTVHGVKKLSSECPLAGSQSTSKYST